VTVVQHGIRVGLLSAFAAVLLGWLSAHTEILFADGLRYVAQAQRIDQGALVDGLLKSVDHPAYPLGIVAAHRLIGGTGPQAWQDAAQLASVVAGVLLVLPLYLVVLELFGPRAASMGVFLVYVVPLNAHVLADALSESTFLLFWTWGLWASLKFLKAGTFGWLPLMVGCGVLAYLTRPEGLLLPAAVVATLAAMPLLRSTRLYWPRWVAAVMFLVVGPALLAGPYVAFKGGLATKPAVARILGTAPRSAPDAVERARPLDPNQTTSKTYVLAVKATFEAIRDAVTVPLLPFALVGLWASRPFHARGRVWLFLGIVLLASVLALVRLHATGGYCTPRHAMILSLMLIPAAALGLDHVLGRIAVPARWLGKQGSPFRAGPAIWGLALIGYLAWATPALLAPVNAGLGGYRAAGMYLTQHAPPGTKVVDVTGWSLYYGERSGYTFANLIEAPGDPNLRWVVARDAHLKGPWGYCRQLRALVTGLEPVATFPEKEGPNQARVYVFDRLSRTVRADGSGEVRRR
jgi:4-amino-4-deoxy-L-arabinose transferase-like glycosyltransferase